jgi:hypothetical protein
MEIAVDEADDDAEASDPMNGWKYCHPWRRCGSCRRLFYWDANSQCQGCGGWSCATCWDNDIHARCWQIVDAEWER